MKILLFLSLIFILISCNDETTGPQDNTKIIFDKTINPADSQQNFVTSDGLRIIVSAGSLTDKIGIKITKVDRPDYNNTEDYILGDNVFKISVTGEYKVITPIEIRLKYDKSKIKSGMNAIQSVRGLVYQDNDFSKLENIVDISNEEIVFYMIPTLSSKVKSEEHILGNKDAIIGDKYKNTDKIQNSETVKIGSQIWMNKNLDVAYYRNGEEIPQIQDSSEWVFSQNGAWCYYNNDPAMGAIYGKIYNWYAVNDPRGLAPEGWHVATNEEYFTLYNSFSNVETVGGQLKEAGTSHWKSPNNGATNSSGLTMLPGGYRSYYGRFYETGYYGLWWTADTNGDNAYFLLLTNDSTKTHMSYGAWWAGASVRCVKD